MEAERARVRVIVSDTYREGLAELESVALGEVQVVEPSTRAARVLVRKLGVTVLPERGFLTSHATAAVSAGHDRHRCSRAGVVNRSPM